VQKVALVLFHEIRGNKMKLRRENTFKKIYSLFQGGKEEKL
jgi:hypothetical protein